MSPCLSVSSDRTVTMHQLRVAVVGEGDAGLCAARHILSRPDTFAPPVAYELTEHVAGTWFYKELTGSYDNGLPIHSNMYRDLRTNLPKEVMMFPDFPFDPQLPPSKHTRKCRDIWRDTARATASHQTSGTLLEEVIPVTMATEKGLMSAWEAKGSTVTYTATQSLSQATPVVEVQEGGSLQFQDGSITQAQVLLFCTGYNFSYPFLEPAQLGLVLPSAPSHTEPV
ncbi:uncharacterized protein [Salvelinus alpinus]|uniref:uncharacterized protein n=1 Tax=Salvelinus alpinus TaxID=8036 RepID=UPI0039FC1EDF